MRVSGVDARIVERREVSTARSARNRLAREQNQRQDRRIRAISHTPIAPRAAAGNKHAD
jgi:hypothetical protein